MFHKHRNESSIDERRFAHATLFVFLFIGILLARLWYLQLYRGEHYNQLSESNRMRRMDIQAPRGRIFDRKGRLILGNRPFYDLVLVPQFVERTDETLLILANLLREPIQKLRKAMRKVQGQPRFLPVTLKRNLTLHQVGVIEELKTFLPGVDIHMAPRRSYTQSGPAHILGYIGEISPESLKRRNKQNASDPYLPGDLVGKYGLESQWEALLRGKRGYSYIQVDAFGRQTKQGSYQDFFSKPAIPGADLVLTIDMELQKAAEAAFYGKNGAVIVMDPKNGDILAMLSSPSFDPAIYQKGISYDQWQALVNHPFKPLFDKTTGGAFPPGSVYKPVIALAALEEGIVDLKKTHKCTGKFQLGRDSFHCHRRFGHGLNTLAEAMRNSCDVFFYHLGVELGVDTMAKYAKDFALGSKLGVRLNREDAGLIPSNAWRSKHFRSPYTVGDAPNLAIGQGDNLMTPIQMASLYATIANGGKVWRPIVVKRAMSPIGELIFEHRAELVHQVSLVSKQNFRKMRNMLKEVVHHPKGTGRQAFVAGRTVAGKTGSVQVVSLKKARSRSLQTVRMKWQEHALFAMFSPFDNAEIVIAVVSEHDNDGGGGSAAAPIARKIVKAFFAIKERERLAHQNKRGAEAL